MTVSSVTALYSLKLCHQNEKYKLNIFHVLCFTISLGNLWSGLILMLVIVIYSKLLSQVSRQDALENDFSLISVFL